MLTKKNKYNKSGVLSLPAVKEQVTIESSESLFESNSTSHLLSAKEIESQIKYYKQAISVTHEFISIVDRAYTYQLVNEYYLTQFELKHEDIIGHKVMELHGKERFETILKSNLDKALAGEDVHIKHWIELPKGKRYLDSLYSPFTNTSGDILGVVINARDITDEKNTIEALKLSDEIKGTILNSALDAVISVDEDGEIREFNPSAEQMFGYVVEEATGKNISELFFFPGLERHHRVSFKQYLKKNKKNILGKRLQITAINAEGKILPVELSLAEIHFEQQCIFTAFIRDLSERFEFQDKLMMSEERYRSMIEAEPECVKSIRRDGTLINMNATGLAYIEAENFEQVKGACVYDLVIPEHRNAFIKMNERIFEGEKCNLQFQIEGLKGTRRWMETHAVPIYESGDENDVTAHLAVTRDITEQKQSELLEDAQRNILEQIVSGKPQAEILKNLCLRFESLSPKGAVASILLVNSEDNKLYVGAAPSMSEKLLEAIQGFPIGHKKASCGTAVACGEKVIVEDISSSELWEEFYDFAAANNLQSCWSTPFFSKDKKVLGTFAITFTSKTTPTQYDIERLEMGEYLASIVVERAQSIEALRESESKFSKMFISNPASMTLTKLDDGTFIDVNERFEGLTGISRAEAIGKSSLELNIYVDPEQRSHLVQEIKSNKLVKDFEMDIQTRAGEFKKIFFSAELMRIGEGEFILGSQIDITEQKRLASLEAGRTQILEALAKNEELKEMLRMVAISTSKQLTGVSVSILLADKEEKYLVFGAAYGLPEFYIQALNELEILTATGSCPVAIKTGQRVISRDINTDPDWADYLELTQKAGLNSCWSEPIISSRGKTLGVLAIYSGDIRTPDKHEIELIENQTKLVAIAIERKQDEEVLRDSEARFRSAFGNAPMGTALVDKKGIVLQANSRSTRIIGFTPNEIIGKSIGDVTHPDDLSESMEKFIALMSGKIDSYQIEKQYRHKEKGFVWCRLSISSVKDKNNEPVHAIAHIEDISERKKSEAALLRYNRALEMVNQCNDTLIDATNREALLEQVCNIIVNTGGYRFAWVGYAQSDAEKSIMPMAKAGIESGYFDEKISWEKQDGYCYPVAEAIITSKPVTIKNIKTASSSIIFRHATLERGYNSCTALPLIAEGQAFAAIVIYSSECEVFDDEELALLIKLADNLSFGIQSIMNRIVREEAEHSLRISEKKFRSLFDENPCMFFTVDYSANILSVNKFGAMHLGYDAEQMKGRSLFNFIYEDDNYKFSDQLEVCLKKPDEIHNWEMRTSKNDGEILWLRVLARVVAEGINEETIFIVCEDITEARILSDKLVHEATHDGLTGLINRHEFEKRLQRALLSSQFDNTAHVLCFMDLDRFKIINDTCGHLAGDKLLKQLSQSLNLSIRNRDSLARLGGDEFGLLIEHCSLHKAEEIANKIKQAVTDFRFYWDDNVFKIGVSIGIVEINSSSIGISDVLMAADNACYTAKDKGRDRIHIHMEGDTELENRRREMLWTTRIQKAFEEGHFCLVYQTIIPLDVHENKGEHGEILIRMKDETGSMIGPDVFIPVAERYNLIKNIDMHVIDMAFRWFNESPDFLKNLYLCSINLSGSSMDDDYVLKYIIEKFSEYNVPPDKFCFEVTETAAIANLSSANHFISTLKKQGCKFALDDFGSGLSSFAYLKALDVDFLKIDGAFVKDIENEQGDLAIVKSIHEIGRALNKKTIAEFVENDSILKILKGIGVNYAQGYGIERPRPLIEITTHPEK